MAFRGASTRMGTLLGPFIGGGLVASFALRSIFPFSGAIKFVILAAVPSWLRETRQEVTRKAIQQGAGESERLDWSIFQSRAFLTVALSTFAISLIGQGSFPGSFPHPPQ